MTSRNGAGQIPMSSTRAASGANTHFSRRLMGGISFSTASLVTAPKMTRLYSHRV